MVHTYWRVNKITTRFQRRIGTSLGDRTVTQ